MDTIRFRLLWWGGGFLFRSILSCVRHSSLIFFAAAFQWRIRNVNMKVGRIAFRRELFVGKFALQILLLTTNAPDLIFSSSTHPPLHLHVPHHTASTPQVPQLPIPSPLIDYDHPSHYYVSEQKQNKQEISWIEKKQGVLFTRKAAPCFILLSRIGGEHTSFV